MAPRRWKKSQRSGDRGACVELATSTRGVSARDSKTAHTSAVLSIDPQALRETLRERF